MLPDITIEGNEEILEHIDSLNALKTYAFNNSVNKGFYAGVTYPLSLEVQGLKICLMHSELLDALEAIRQKDPSKNNLGEELADCVIRILDFCGAMGINLGNEVVDKMRKNAGRSFMHGKTC